MNEYNISKIYDILLFGQMSFTSSTFRLWPFRFFFFIHFLFASRWCASQKSKLEWARPIDSSSISNDLRIAKWKDKNAEKMNRSEKRHKSDSGKWRWQLSRARAKRKQWQEKRERKNVHKSKVISSLLTATTQRKIQKKKDAKIIKKKNGAETILLKWIMIVFLIHFFPSSFYLFILSDKWKFAFLCSPDFLLFHLFFSARQQNAVPENVDVEQRRLDFGSENTEEHKQSVDVQACVDYNRIMNALTVDASSCRIRHIFVLFLA